MDDKEEKPAGVVAYLAYVYSHVAYSKHKNAIFRCIVRKSPNLPTDAYLAYVRVENQGFDKTRR